MLLDQHMIIESVLNFDQSRTLKLSKILPNITNLEIVFDDQKSWRDQNL